MKKRFRLKMHNLPGFVILGLLVIGLKTDTLAQDKNLNQIQRSFDKYQSDVFHEKVFVHTDRQFYLAGELMWFKSYVTDVATNKASLVSKVAYLELFDESKKSVLQTKIALSSGLGNGSIFLPANLKSGNYILRAYTSWMMNFGAEFFFEKQVTILNSLSAASTEAANNANYDIQFFPEGGELLTNVESKVAFRITSSNGVGQSFRGAVVDERNDTVARFQPLQYGIGHFSFKPLQSKTYRAVIQLKGIPQPLVKDLPAVQQSGYNLSVQTGNTGQVNVKVNASQNNNVLVYLFVHKRQQTSVAERGVVSNGSVSFTIDVAKLGEGISHFTVFDGNLKPVAERLYFKRPQRQLAIQVSPDKNLYATRNKVDIEVTALSNSRPIAADMSMAVFKTDSLSAAAPLDFFNYQWLTSELKGSVEQPDYYFQTGNAEVDQALDNLMLTHGWRRFKWMDVIKGTEPLISHIPEVEGHIINGVIKNRLTGIPAAGVMTFLSVPSKRTQIYSSRSDKNGSVRFFTKDLFGPGELVVQTNVMQDSVYVIDIKDPFSESLPQTSASAFSLPAVSYGIIQDRHMSTQVQNAFVADKLRSFKTSVADSLAFYGRPEYVYKLDDYVRFKTTEEVLREYVPAVVVLRQRTNFNVMVDKKTITGPVNSVPLLIFDGVPVFDRGNRMMAYDPAKIQRLEVSTKNSFLGDTTFNSIVNFTTFKGNLEGFELDLRDLVIDYEGLQLQREFFSPVYQTETQQSSRLPDLRQLLYWSPEVKTDASGKQTLSFYSSDQPGKYTIVVQGLSSDGKPGSGTAAFEIK